MCVRAGDRHFYPWCNQWMKRWWDLLPILYLIHASMVTLGKNHHIGTNNLTFSPIQANQSHQSTESARLWTVGVSPHTDDSDQAWSGIYLWNCSVWNFTQQTVLSQPLTLQCKRCSLGWCSTSPTATTAWGRHSETLRFAPPRTDLLHV